MRYRDGAVFNDRFKVRPVGEQTHRWATAEDAATIRGMVMRGDKQQHIAAYFDVNPGRVAEVKYDRRFPGVPPAPSHRLPPPGPPKMPESSISGIAADFRREQRRTNEKLDHLLRQLAAFGREIGLLEKPSPPRISRRDPLGS